MQQLELRQQPVVFVAMPFFGVANTPDQVFEAQKIVAGNLARKGYLPIPIHLGPGLTVDQGDYVVMYKDASMVGKGTCVSHALTMARIQSEKYYKGVEAFFICCDGSGKIPFQYVTELATKLDDSEATCIVSKRGSEKGIPDVRYAIERFEMSLLFNNPSVVNKLDGQTGLWGFNMTKCPEISLTSDGYEVELEFLLRIRQSESAKLGVLPIEAKPGPSRFNENYNETGSHYKKLKFLMRELALEKTHVLDTAKKFTASKLPPEYIAMIETRTWPTPLKQEGVRILETKDLVIFQENTQISS